MLLRPWLPFVLLAAVAGCRRGPRKADGSVASSRDGFGLGRAATAEEIRAWDDDVLPDGAGLPPGSGTAESGEPIYSSRCASCHGPKGRGGTALPLVGGSERSFGYRIGHAPSGEPRPSFINFFPYATTLFDYTRRAMPFNAPGSLRDDETYSVVAWMLYINGLVGKADVIDKDALPKIKMPALAFFVYDEATVARTR
jgi:mono/diheme cytochrome c family protein